MAMDNLKPTSQGPRVRFAPSPTGFLHIGGARTALFNWLFARGHNGTFILRIEDTDVARSSADMIEGILEGLTWLGLSWDEGPFFQSQRTAQYAQQALRLLEGGSAYRCFCSPEELAARRALHPPGGPPWKYDRRCRQLSAQDIAERLAQGRPWAVRFGVPQGTTRIQDRVFGEVVVENSNVEDFVLLRSDGLPTYHLSVVTDDVDMNITHVIRGADHLANTSKHILLFEALGAALPEFAHVPLILGPDKKRLSKRHGATSVTAYRDMGLLPDAMVNYLSLLGWSPGGDQEIFSRHEIWTRFELDAIHKSSAVFDLQKLEWMNSQYLQKMPLEDLARLVEPVLHSHGLWKESFETSERGWLLQALDLLRERARTLTDLVEMGRAFFTDSFDYEAQARQKYFRHERLPEALRRLAAEYARLEPFDLQGTEAALRSVAGQMEMKAGDLIGAVRVALTGRGVAPGLFEVMVLLGRQATLSRLERVMVTIGNPK